MNARSKSHSNLNRSSTFIEEYHLRFVADGRNVTENFIDTYTIEILLYNEIEQNVTYYIKVHLLSDKPHIERTAIDKMVVDEPWKFSTPILEKFIIT